MWYVLVQLLMMNQPVILQPIPVYYETQVECQKGIEHAPEFQAKADFADNRIELSLVCVQVEEK